MSHTASDFAPKSATLAELREKQYAGDPRAFWTAGQLRREMNLTLDDGIPDCAVVHRNAVRFLPAGIRVTGGKIVMGWDVFFDEPLTWSS